MTSIQDRKQVLIEHKVITDVLPGELELSYDLTLRWPNATLDTPGPDLDFGDTQPEPKVYITPQPSEKLDDFVLIMTDPDLMMNDDTYFGQVRHWLVTNLSTDSDGSLTVSNGTVISPYVYPSPLPNYMYARPHRYVFILARGSGKVEVTPEDLKELQGLYTAAVAGKQSEVQDLKDRWGFNAQKLIEKKGLKVEAVNFMRVGGTLKSAAATTAMMGQAMANKVVGK